MQQKIEDYVKRMGPMGQRKLFTSMRSAFPGNGNHPTLDQIRQYLRTADGEKRSRRYYQTNLVHNFFGKWSFDIMYSRIKHDVFYGIFLHENSGYARIYLLGSRTKENIKLVTTNFKKWLRERGLPLAPGIKSDAEKALLHNEDYDARVAKEEHHRLGPINGFINAVRTWVEQREGTRAVKYDELLDFTYRWNSEDVKGTRTPRYEMVLRPYLEEALIAKRLYENEPRYEHRFELQPGTEVRLQKKEQGRGEFEKRTLKLRPGKYIIRKVTDLDVEVENPKGEREHAYFGDIRRIKKKEPQVQQVDEAMLQQAGEKKEDEITFEEEPEPVIPNLDAEVETYEQNVEKVQEEALNQVDEAIVDRAEMDLAQGFKPETRAEVLLEMQDKKKKEIEENTNKVPVGAYATNFTPGQVKFIARKLSGLRNFSNYGELRQNLRKTKADEDYVFKSPEIVGARLIAEQARKKALPTIEKINPVIAERRKDLFFEATA